MYKIDLHTHSTDSPDGGISADEYQEIFESKILDTVAITDHNSIALGLELNTKFGQKVIVGEEIMTRDGEIIGLFLSKKIEPKMSLIDTVAAIKSQGGIVYVPHPFEKVRKGLSIEALDSIAKDVDIVEVYNARAVNRNSGQRALTWARLNSKATAASSDAHGKKGLGTSYSMVDEQPTKKNFVSLMKMSKLETRRPPLHTLLYPKLNRLRGKF